MEFKDHPFITSDDKLLIPQRFLMDLHSQLKVNAAVSKKRKSYEAISFYAKDCFNKLQEEKRQLFDIYNANGIGLTTSSIERAIKGERAGKSSVVKYELLEFLCHASWPDRNLYLFEYIIDEKYTTEKTKYSVDIPDYAKDRLLESNYTKPDPQIASIKAKESVTKYRCFKKITKQYWDDLQIKSDGNRLNACARYYTHIDATLIPQAVANDLIVPPCDMFDIVDSDKNISQKTIGQVLDIASSESFSLIKILAEGGIGKSTFLYWIAKEFYENYTICIIKKLTEALFDEITSLCTIPSTTGNNRFIFILDNVADVESSRQVKDLLSDLKGFTFNCSITFIFAERDLRYNSLFTNSEVEKLFSGFSFTIKYQPPNVEQVFDNLFSLLQQTNNQLDLIIKEEVRAIFCNPVISSLSEKTFLVLNHLTVKNELRYDFDWTDWDRFILARPQFAALEHLFIIVATFYQFGIRVRIDLKTPFLKNGDRLIILKALQSFSTDKSPIVLSEDCNFLSLKHEHVASWFLRNGREQLAIGFFRGFINEINDTTSAKLFRKIRKILKSEEFKRSCLANELDAEQSLKIIDNYLELPALPTEESEKMMNEKGMVLMSLNKVDSARMIFKHLSDQNLKNNHSRDQLARISIKYDNDHGTAMEYYLQIIRNGGDYAVKMALRTYRECLQKKIRLSVSEDRIVPLINNLEPNRQYRLMKQLILDKEFNLVEQQLAQLPDSSMKSVLLHQLAESLPFKRPEIERKTLLYKQAVFLQKTFENEKLNIWIYINYAVFLFRIRKYGESTKFINDVQLKYPDIQIKKVYYNKIRSVQVLVFGDLPHWGNHIKYKNYLSRQCHDAAALINKNQNDIYIILRGYLILQTVRFYTRYYLLPIYLNASKQLAYCHTYHASKGWNNLSIRDNRVIAEKLYDYVIDKGSQLTQSDDRDMLKNLLSFNEPDKSKKVLWLVENILRKPWNKRCSVFYRYKGNAKKNLRNLGDAFKAYNEALSLCSPEFFDFHEEYVSDKCSLLNNIVQLVCDCVENNQFLDKLYSLQDALGFCNEIETLRPTFHYLESTRNRVLHLLKST
jgi:hypothetical protein